MIVILGATGFVGRALLSNWPGSAGPAKVLVHRSRPDWLRPSDNLAIVDVDLAEASSVAAAVGGCPVMINLLRPLGDGWYPETMGRLSGPLADAGVRRVVHASSIDVYNGKDDLIVDERTVPVARTAYEREHLHVERIIQAAFAETAILRLGAVFGEGGRNIVAFAGEMQRAPFWKLALRRALYGKRRMHLVGVQTVCQALLFFALHRQQLNSQVVLVTGDASPDNHFAHIQDALAEAFGRPRLDGIPTLPAALLGVLLRLRGLSPALAKRRFSSTHLEELGFAGENFNAELAAYVRSLARSAADVDAQ